MTQQKRENEQHLNSTQFNNAAHFCVFESFMSIVLWCFFHKKVHKHHK